MSEGMPPHFLLYLLNERLPMVRYGKLAAAHLWLQSQMAAAICLHQSEELRELYTVENGQRFPYALAEAAAKKLEKLSSESLRREFTSCFRSEITKAGIRKDIEAVCVLRDTLAHGYVSLFQAIVEEDSGVLWSPRASGDKMRVLREMAGPPPPNAAFRLRLTQEAFEDEVERVCRVMDFIASMGKKRGLDYVLVA